MEVRRIELLSKQGPTKQRLQLIPFEKPVTLNGQDRNWVGSEVFVKDNEPLSFLIFFVLAHPY